MIFFYPHYGLAKWSKLFSGRDNTSFHVDLKTLEVEEQIRRIMFLIDYKNPNEHGDLSSIIKREINCNELMYRDLEINFFKINKGKGTKSRGSGKIKNPKWQYYPPGSSGGEIIKIICKLDSG